MKFVYKIFFCAIVIIVNKQTESKPQFRIFNGFKLADGEFSTYVRTEIKYKSYTSRCEGVLLNDELVLTVAQCTVRDDYYNIIVYIGEDNLNISKFIRGVKKVIMHENFEYIYNNIALYVLDSPIPNSKYIKYANLPKKELTKLGDTIYLVGRDPPKNDLAASNQTIIPDKECYEFFYSSEPSDGQLICSKSKTESTTCSTGYDGGPAYFVDNNGKQWVVGINSFGDKIFCDIKLKLIVMVRLSYYYNWIQQKRKEIKCDSKIQNCLFSSTVGIKITYVSDSFVGKCSGVLLDDQTVLTAAHCTANDRYSNIIVYIGDEHSKTVPTAKFTRKVKKIIRHENVTNLNNDLALYLLDSRIPYHKDIKYANLPSEELTKLGDTVHLVVSGRSNFNLLTKNHTILMNEKCNKIPSDTQICMYERDTEGNYDDCVQYAGAPGYFVDNMGSQWLIGIHSLGASCNIKVKFHAMMRVSYYYNWIKVNRELIKSE